MGKIKCTIPDKIMTIIFDLIYKEGTIISSGGEKNLELLKHVSQAFKQLLRIHFERPLSIVEEKKKRKEKKRRDPTAQL